MRQLSTWIVTVVCVSWWAFGCGGGDQNGTSSTTTTTTHTTTTTLPPGTANVARLVVDGGPTDTYVNGLFTSVTICLPGSDSSCQRIDHVLVDTGSTGLRILSSALSLSLPQQTGPRGNPVAECFPFVSGITWGPIQIADVKIAGEVAASVPIQVIGHPQFSEIPQECMDMGPVRDTLDELMANGILGIGLTLQDCGSGCAVSLPRALYVYYECSSLSCQKTTLELTKQVQHPVWHFTDDNNGLIIDLPPVGPTGAASVQGTLIFGIGTQSNNQLGSTKVLTTDARGTFTTIYNGQSYGNSFIDSGSNGIFFLNEGRTGIPTCSEYPDWYCPQTTLTLSATNKGVNRETSTVQFSVANADSLFQSSPSYAYSNLAGPFMAELFDWGLPFFFGRRVFTAIEGQRTPAGLGPYWAY